MGRGVHDLRNGTDLLEAWLEALMSACFVVLNRRDHHLIFKSRVEVFKLGLNQSSTVCCLIRGLLTVWSSGKTMSGRLLGFLLFAKRGISKH